MIMMTLADDHHHQRAYGSVAAAVVLVVARVTGDMQALKGRFWCSCRPDQLSSVLRPPGPGRVWVFQLENITLIGLAAGRHTASSAADCAAAFEDAKSE
jgi:hypothetical protein